MIFRRIFGQHYITFYKSVTCTPSRRYTTWINRMSNGVYRGVSLRLYGVKTINIEYWKYQSGIY